MRVATAAAAAPSVSSFTASAESKFEPLVLAIQRLRDGGGSVELPAVVAKGVTRDFFDDFLTAHEDRMGVSLEYRDSCIFAYECPVSAIHERVSIAVYDSLRAAIGIHAFNFSGGAPSCWVGGSLRMPDASLTPRAKPNPGIGAVGAADNKGVAYPNVIVEVAVSQPLADVFSKAAEWVGASTTVQQAIVVKVGDALGGGARDLHAYSFVRGAGANPVETIDFSIPLHSAAGPGSPGMQLRVPLAGLYFQVAGGSPAGMADPLELDLFVAQQLAADVTP